MRLHAVIVAVGEGQGSGWRWSVYLGVTHLDSGISITWTHAIYSVDETFRSVESTSGPKLHGRKVTFDHTGRQLQDKNDLLAA